MTKGQALCYILAVIIITLCAYLYTAIAQAPTDETLLPPVATKI